MTDNQVVRMWSVLSRVNAHRALVGLIAALAIFPLSGYGKNKPEKELASFVTELNARCPITQQDGWAMGSLAVTNDTVSIELYFPALLRGFLPALTVNTPNARKLWVKQMNMFGEDWRQLVRLLVAARFSLVLQLTLGDERPEATMTLTAEDFD